jgi:aminopeptidase N
VDLLRPYAERYFALVPALWHDRGPQVSLTLAQGLYPLALADDETVARSAAGLADEGLHPAARRILLEQTDHLHRVRAARAAARG